MFITKPNKTVTISYKKYKNINDPNEVMIHYDRDCNNKIDEDIPRSIISYVQSKFEGSNYFRLNIKNEYLTIFYFHRRKTNHHLYFKFDSMFLYKNLLYIKENSDDKEFDILKDRIQKINNLKNI